MIDHKIFINYFNNNQIIIMDPCSNHFEFYDYKLNQSHKMVLDCNENDFKFFQRQNHCLNIHQQCMLRKIYKYICCNVYSSFF